VVALTASASLIGMLSTVQSAVRGLALIALASLAAACAAPTKVPTAVAIPGTAPDDAEATYFRRVREQINRMLPHPCSEPKSENCSDGEVQVEIRILASGALQSATVVQSSGIPLYDSYAVTATRLAAPFPPVPDAVMARFRKIDDQGRSYFGLKGRFTFSTTNAATVGR